ncbi:MAG: hypothetical protein JO121_25435, partial [Deltaproteobacteria bacterium]|nr:hypothetical protein [Deltaproteobacteria bacterium]
QLVGPSGVQVLAARIPGGLTLDLVAPPFGISLINSSILGRVSLTGAQLRWVVLSGSETGEIYAPEITSGVIWMNGVRSSGPLDLDGAKIDGSIYLAGAHFLHAPLPYLEELNSWNLAVRMAYAKVRGFVDLTHGFEADGAVEIDNSSIGGDFTLFGSRFINPKNVALNAASDVIGGDVMLSFTVEKQLPAQFDGAVQFIDDQIAGGLYADKVSFEGDPGTRHGLYIVSTPIKGSLFVRSIALRNGGELFLGGSTVHTLFDDEQGWPKPGKLTLDGFSYDYLGNPLSADARVRWLALQPGFNPQPYKQLAKVLAESGDDAGAIRVRIAAEDLRYARLGLLGRIWGAFLKKTIGYGHRPMLTIMWSVAVVIFGWLVVSIGGSAGIMRRTWPENAPRESEKEYEPLRPLVYSLDVFLPFVNLHQEHYWWPNTTASGACRVLGVPINLKGSLILYYLWVQIIAGWILSAIFVAGVTGLIRNE